MSRPTDADITAHARQAVDAAFVESQRLETEILAGRMSIQRALLVAYNLGNQHTIDGYAMCGGDGRVDPTPRGAQEPAADPAERASEDEAE